MKKVLSIILCAVLTLNLVSPVYAAAVNGHTVSEMRNALAELFLITAVLFLLAIIITVFKLISGKKPGKGVRMPILVMIYVAGICTLAVTLFCSSIYRTATDTVLQTPIQTLPTVSETTPMETETEPLPTETEPPTEPETVPPTEPEPQYAPHMTELSNPANWGVEWEIIENGAIVDSYNRADPIFFGDGADYFALPGIATFRGNNYRNSAAYGTAQVSNAKLQKVWSHKIGMLDGWGGCAWTGQPLVVQWDEETKAIMNLYEDKKSKEDLVEVIYATLDGRVHFFDLEDGSKTRDHIEINMNFKGAGALDPRGYPLLYVGSGLYTFDKHPRMYVVSLITGEIIYEYGHMDPFAERPWSAFDSSPLVDAETDTLIWPGENGLLYTIKLNTQYDKEAGTISVSPDEPVKTRYRTQYNTSDDRYLGYESSVSIVENYLYVSENGGMFYCVDLNTMELVWAQDTKDDSNSSPVFEWGEDGNGYIYTAPSLHWTAQGNKGAISIYKLNARTGEIVWEVSRDCVTVKDLSGGVQATPLLGKEGTSIENMVIYIVARHPKTYEGVMIALDRNTGEVIWEIPTVNYAWSSPNAFYTEDGDAYIVFTNASGKMRLVDGKTGEVLDSLGLEETAEASPIIFNNMMVMGTREGIYGIKIS